MQNKIQVEDLFSAGLHYGHKSIKSTPKMKKYIHSVKWGISIIDLAQTAVMMSKSLDTLFNIAKKGGSVWFVGTKHQAKDLVAKYALECNQFYINKRWLGGSITNYYVTIIKKINALKEIEKQEDLGFVSKLSKKEQGKVAEKKRKLKELVDGVKDSPNVPSAIVVIDANIENVSILEAKKSGIPVIALTDTNVKNPSLISNIVPGNDDGTLAIDFFLNKCKESIIEGAKLFKKEKAKEVKENDSNV